MKLKSLYQAIKPYNEIPTVPFPKMAFKRMRQKNKLDKVFEELFYSYGPIFRIRVPGQYDTVCIKSPNEMAELLTIVFLDGFPKDGKWPINSNFDFVEYYRRNMRWNLFPETGGPVGSHGEYWWFMRSNVQQELMRSNSAMFYINETEMISYELVELIAETLDKSKEVDDLLDITFLWALESITATFLDSKLRCLKPDLPESSDAMQFIKALKIGLSSDLTKLALDVPVWKYISTPAFSRFDKAAQTVYDISRKIVEKAHIDTENRNSILQKLKQRCGGDSTIPMLMSQDALTAGVDTTGTTAAFLMLDLARNPDKQEFLYEEIRSVIGLDPDVNNVTQTKLGKMRYLKACLHESLRVNPVVTALSRRTQTNIVLGGYQIPEGVNVSYFLMLAMRDPSNWMDPEKFVPERWLRGCPLQHSAHPLASISFGHGPRMCVGRRFAELEIYILTIKMLQRFRLEYHHQPVGVNTGFVNKPDAKIKLRFVSR